jgi:hypothetical protein
MAISKTTTSTTSRGFLDTLSPEQQIAALKEENAVLSEALERAETTISSSTTEQRVKTLEEENAELADEYQQLQPTMISRANPLIGPTKDDTSSMVQAMLRFLSLATGGLDNGFGITDEQGYGFSLALDTCIAALEIGDEEGLSATCHSQLEGGAA